MWQPSCIGIPEPGVRIGAPRTGIRLSDAGQWLVLRSSVRTTAHQRASCRFGMYVLGWAWCYG